jgi:hypothetical protein
MPFGYYFSYFVVLSRCVLAIVWLGLVHQTNYFQPGGLTMGSVQTTTGGQCMTVLLTATWPSFANIPNHIPESEGITTAGMVGFLLYFLLQLPFLCIPYTKVHMAVQPPFPGSVTWTDIPEDPILFRLQKYHRAHRVLGHIRRYIAQGRRHPRQQCGHHTGQYCGRFSPCLGLF